MSEHPATTTQQYDKISNRPGKPFLKWAGGKNWFVKHLPRLLNNLNFNEYHEPFLGGGSVFFSLAPDRAYLSDTNEELITTYIGIRDDVEDVINAIKQWTVDERTYYSVRSYCPDNPSEKAARFIYLNRTSFNGIYRVNRNGVYNVPYGHNDGYQFDYQRIRDASSLLQGATLTAYDYEQALTGVKTGDLVFLDPPYTVAHKNNGFIEYNKKPFSLEDQFRLRQCIDTINETGAYFILTNAVHQTIRDIFDGCGQMLELPRHSTIGGKQATRQPISEYAFTNIPNTNNKHPQTHNN